MKRTILDKIYNDSKNDHPLYKGCKSYYVKVLDCTQAKKTSVFCTFKKDFLTANSLFIDNY